MPFTSLTEDAHVYYGTMGRSAMPDTANLTALKWRVRCSVPTLWGRGRSTMHQQWLALRDLHLASRARVQELAVSTVPSASTRTWRVGEYTDHHEFVFSCAPDDPTTNDPARFLVDHCRLPRLLMTTAAIDPVGDLALIHALIRGLETAGYGLAPVVVDAAHWPRPYPLRRYDPAQHPDEHPEWRILNTYPALRDGSDPFRVWVLNAYPHLRRRWRYGPTHLGHLFFGPDFEGLQPQNTSPADTDLCDLTEVLVITGLDAVDTQQRRDILTVLNRRSTRSYIALCSHENYRQSLPPQVGMNNTLHLSEEPGLPPEGHAAASPI